MYTEPCISFTPSRIALFTKVLDEDGNPFRRPKSDYSIKVHDAPVVNPMPESTAHNGEVSRKASRRIRDKINWLVSISKNQKVTYPNGRVSTNFRIAMITLTLPSKQVHSDKEIKQKCLNQFLTELRTKYGMKHYVWKAELQKNENIHFHLTTNTFINHVIIKNTWNRITSKLGYVQSYAARMRQMSFQDYERLRRSSGENDLKKIRKAYDVGCKEDWISPNSTDVKTVFKVENLAAYLAKYLAKSVGGVTPNNFDEGRIKDFGGRIWYCSQSISKLKSYITITCNRVMGFVSNLVQSAGVRVMEFEYCTCIYFDRSKIPPKIRSILEGTLSSYVKNQWATL